MGTDIEKSIKGGLSKREALALTRLAAQNKTIITIKDIEDILDVPYDEAKKIAHNLTEKKWLNRLKRGTYLIVPLEAGETGEYTEHEYIIASHLADTMYISYWTALNHHNLTEQVPVTVYAATTERVPERIIHNITYKFVTLTEKKFFGYEPEAINSHRVNIATPEKAVADCADHPEHCGGITELAKALNHTETLDTEALTDYLLRMENGAAIKRVVYLSDILNIALPRRNELEEGFTTGYSELDPTCSDEGTHSRKYRLLLNISENKLKNMVGEQS